MAQNETNIQDEKMTQQEREQAYRQHVEQTTPKYSMPRSEERRVGKEC